MTRFSIFSLLTIFTLSASSQVSFQEMTFEQALRQASDEGKLVMVDAYTDWCGWCKELDEKTFSNSTVGDFIDSLAVSLKLNMEEGMGAKLAMKHRVSFYPQTLFFDTSGNLVARVGGFKLPAEFIEATADALSKDNRLAPQEAPLNFDIYPEFLYKTYLKSSERSWPAAEEVNEFLENNPDVTNEVTWAIVNRFIQEGPFVQLVIDNKKELIEKYGEEEMNSKLSAILFSEVKAAIKEKNRDALERSLDKADEYFGDKADYYSTRYRLYYFQMLEQWEDFALTGQKIASNPDNFDAYSLNDIAWTLSQKSSDPKALSLAEKWMKEVIEKEPAYGYLDTYAWLLYKLNRLDEARIAADKALAKAEETEEDGQSTKELLGLLNTQ